MDKGSLVMHHTHASTTTATSGFDDDRVANGFGNSANLGGIVGQFAFRARHTRHTRFDHGLLGGYLVTHRSNGLWGGANEGEATFFNPFSKISVFT